MLHRSAESGSATMHCEVVLQLPGLHREPRASYAFEENRNESGAMNIYFYPNGRDEYLNRSSETVVLSPCYAAPTGSNPLATTHDSQVQRQPTCFNMLGTVSELAI